MKNNINLKVFHGLVNYGTQAGLFSKKLRELGVDSLSVSAPDPFKRQIDFELLHGGSFIKKIFNRTKNLGRKVYWFFRFNIFHFYYGTSLLPLQIDLPIYKLFGKKVIMHYLGADVQLYQYSINKYDITNVKYYFKDGPAHDQKVLKRLNYEKKYTDKKIVCAPYLSEFVPGSEVLPLAIDLNEYEYCPKDFNSDDLVILHAPTSRDNKGTSFILDALDQLIREGYKIKKILAENVSHQKLKELYKDCHIFIDQVLGGWYGTAAIEAMAIGRPVICFYRKSYFKHIDYGKDIPIINAHKDSIYDVLKQTIRNKERLIEIALKSRKFVEKTHDLEKLTNKLLSYYLDLK